MIVSKFKKKFNQVSYDCIFYWVQSKENGLGDVAVNKMKEFNKILYDILLKLNLDKKQVSLKLIEN